MPATSSYPQARTRPPPKAPFVHARAYLASLPQTTNPLHMDRGRSTGPAPTAATPGLFGSLAVSARPLVLDHCTSLKNWRGQFRGTAFSGSMKVSTASRLSMGCCRWRSCCCRYCTGLVMTAPDGEIMYHCPPYPCPLWLLGLVSEA